MAYQLGFPADPPSIYPRSRMANSMAGTVLPAVFVAIFSKGLPGSPVKGIEPVDQEGSAGYAAHTRKGPGTIAEALCQSAGEPGPPGFLHPGSADTWCTR